MKTRLLTIILALAGLAACNKQSITAEEEFLLEITRDGEYTKSSSASVDINLANLEFPSSRSLTAQLKKRTGSGWVNVDSGVSYNWSSPSEDKNKYVTSGTNEQTCTVTAKAEGNGILNVSANIDGKIVANKDVPVTVSDSRALSWTDVTASIVIGETKTAVLNCNFSCTASISSDNGSLLVGTSSDNLSSSTTVTFSKDKRQTIYYKYTGTEETTITLNAKDQSGNLSSEVSIGTTIAQYTTSCRFTFKSSKPCGYSLDVFNDNQSVCVCECPGTYNQSSSETVEKTGTANVYMTSTDSYYIKITRIYGSTSASILRYNGTLLDKVAASGFIGPYTGADLGIVDGKDNTIILNLITE